MSRGQSDRVRLLTLIGEAHDLDEPEPFTPLVLDRVADVLGCEQASCYELDITTGEVPLYVRSSYEDALATWGSPPFQFLPRVHLERHRKSWDRSQDGVGTWSDLYTRAARRRFEVTDQQRTLGHVDMAWMTFGDRHSSSGSCWVTLGQSRDFTQTQRNIFLGSRTHIASLIRHADTRRRLADLMIAIDADEEADARGTLLLGPSLRVERASPAARRIASRWFGRFGSQLPQQLADWLRTPFPRQPLHIEHASERLVVETPTRSTLVLREQNVSSVPLTPREREVLSLVADGMSTNEIAQSLWVTPATVSKHLEHIYRKLGVTGRTAALAALRRTPA
jgi:DNA-binding CsgD family transcriptional regulator